MKLLSYSNTKTIKGEKLGVKTAILYLVPGSISGRIVIDGDETDARFLDPIFKSGKGTIVGLRSKGSGKQDTSGFVIQLGGKE